MNLVEELVEEVVELLRQQNKTLATAESCTGGLIAATITAHPGVACVFRGGVVSYWPEVKHDVLGVEQSTLDAVGAVSPETARQMAEGACRVIGSDLAVSVTGVAGPDPDDRGNPVGLVYLALSDGKTTIVRAPENLGKERNEIQRNAVAYALGMVKEYFLGNESCTSPLG